MQKKPDWSYQKQLLNNPWCPLFGSLPETYEPPAAVTSQCLQIITAAREIWGAKWQDLLTETNFPNENQVKYDAVRLRAARAIFRSAEELFQRVLDRAASEQYGPEDSSYEESKGIYGTKLTANQVEGKWFVIQANSYIGVRDAELRPCDVASMVALGKAWGILTDLIIYDEAADAVFKGMAKARFMLDRAKDFIQLDRKTKEVSDATRGGVKSGKIRQEKAKPTAEAWQAEAEKIWRKHPAWKNRRVAADIEKRIGGNADTIRKSIKKPLPSFGKEPPSMP